MLCISLPGKASASSKKAYVLIGGVYSQEEEEVRGGREGVGG